MNKIFPIEGDISSEKLGLSADNRALLIEEVNIIINLAASIDFNEPIRVAINTNYFGCLRVLELATSCKHLQVLTHVSTCYVNCDKIGFIKEDIYDINGDSEEIIRNILAMSP